MKKIINKKMYDTETAKLLASGRYSGSRDAYYFLEELYLKRTGEFFLYGEGAPYSKYGEEVGQNCWTWGCDITPLTEDDAMDWAEEYLDADEYIKIFGEPAE